MVKIKYIFLFLCFLATQAHAFQVYSYLDSNNSYKVFSEKGKQGVKHKNGEILVDAEFEAFGWSDLIVRANSEYIGFKKINAWGLMDHQFNILIPAAYQSIIPYQEKFFIVSRKGRFSKTNFYGIVDETGKTKLDFTYHKLIPAENYLIAATQKDQQINFGIISNRGDVIIPFEYYQISYLGHQHFELTSGAGQKSLIQLNPKIKAYTEKVDSVSAFKDGVAILFRNGKQGLIRQDGKILLPIQYKNIEWNNGKHIYVTELDSWSVFNNQGQRIEKYQADSIFYLNNGRLVKNLSNYSQLTKPTGEDLTLEFHAKIIATFGEYFVLKKDDYIYLAKDSNNSINYRFYDNVSWNDHFFMGKQKKYGGPQQLIINKNGTSIAADSAVLMKNQIAIKNKTYWGIYDADFKEIIPSYYESIQAVNQHYIVKFRDMYGVIDQSNEWIIPPRYIKVEQLKKDTYKVVDKFLKEIYIQDTIRKEARLHYDLYEQLIFETDNENNFRLLNLNAEAITKWQKGNYAGHGESGVLIKEKNKHSLINYSGKQLFSIADYHTVFVGEDIYFPIIKDGQFGFINHEGQLRIANRYDSARGFQNDLAAIKIRDSWGFINRQEDLVIQPYYSEVSDFNDQTAFVKINGNYGLIDREGEFILEASYSKIEIQNGYFLLKKGNKWGIADAKAKVIAYPTFDKVSVVDDFIAVEKYGNTSILSKTGEALIDQQFDLIVYDRYNQLFLCRKTAKTQQVFLTDILKGKYP